VARLSSQVNLGSYLGLTLGRVPGFRVDRTGAAIIGAALMVVTGVLSNCEDWT